MYTALASIRTRTTLAAAALALLSAAPLAAQGAGAKIASPRDSVIQTVNGARLAIDYGRPSKRGRVIFGGLEPWNAVWRAGANEATGFVTSKDLVIGGTNVPAGSYTLFILPSPAGWKLVVNEQTGQWGTEYHREQDLARIPMTVIKPPQPVEQLTYSVEPRGRGGVIRMRWDTADASVPFTVKP